MDKKSNPQLSYRIEKEIQDEYKRICIDACIDAGKLIRKFMLDTIEKNNPGWKEKNNY